MKSSKRVIKVLLAAVLCLVLIAGCGSKGVKSSSESKSEKIKIRLLTRMAGEAKQVGIYNEIIEQFKKDHPEVEIVDNSQVDESAFNNLIASDIASGDMPNIFRIQGVANLGEYIDNGLIKDMTPFLEEDKEWGDGFTKGSLSFFNVPGHEGTYGIPMESGTIGFYYNKALLNKAGIAEFPKTWEELMSAIEKLKGIDVIPIAIGAQSTYMAGHIHNNIFYKYLGTEGSKKLGTREMKWTDPDVVQSLQYVKDLINAGAFDKNAAGLTDEMALTQFRQGEAAMILTGPWNIENLTNKETTKVAADVDLADFPYFTEKPEFKNEAMQTSGCYMVNGKLEGKELDLTVELVKRLTDKEAAKRYAEEAGLLIPRTDIEIDSAKVSPLLLKNIKLGEDDTGVGVDVFDYDPIASMQDRTRNSIVSMFVGGDAKTAAKEIQAEIDNNTK